jgi:alanine-glyoxylate transaminase/serine-glyoxylate transaminase/serine-pyruvate transaminase
MNSNKDGYTPYTPSTPMLHGLRKSLDLLLAEGMENVYARHRRLAEGTRQAVAAWGLKLCAVEPKLYSDTVSAVVVPEDKDARDVIGTAFKKYNLSLGAGLSEVAGKVFRIGHVGDMNDVSMLGAIAGVEMAMLDSGFDVKPGSGVAAALEYYRATA